MEKTNISKIIESLSGLQLYEWKSIKSAVNREFDAMSNRLELTDVSKIQKMVLNETIINETIHKEYEATKKCSPCQSVKQAFTKAVQQFENS